MPTNPRSAHEYGEEHAERQDYGEEPAAVCYVESPGAVCPWRLAWPSLCVCDECAGEGCCLLFIKAHCPHLVMRVSAGIALRLRGRAQPVGIGVGARVAAEESMYGGGGGGVGDGGGGGRHPSVHTQTKIPVGPLPVSMVSQSSGAADPGKLNSVAPVRLQIV